MTTMTNLLTILLFLVGLTAIDGKYKNHTGEPCKPTVKSHSDTITVTGIVQSSGATKYMKEKYHLANSEFQILSESGDYFLEGRQDFSSYWGSCIQVSGTLRHIWDDINKQDNVFGRKVIEAHSIVRQDYNDCNNIPISQHTNKDQVIDFINRNYKEVKLEKHTGYLKRTKRPSPDIGQDYGLILDNPITIHDWNSGRLKQISFISVTCINPDMYRQYETYLRDKIRAELEGYIIGGHGHQPSFQIISIKEK